MSAGSGPGAIYLSGVSALDDTGLIVGTGDVGAQTRVVLDRIAAKMLAAGSSIDRIASATVYLRSAADFQRMNEVYRTYWAADPPARTTVATALVHPGALVEIAAVGLAPGAERTVVHPDGWVRSPNPYSYAVRSGDTLFLSGIVPRRGRDNTVVAGDMATQTRAVMDNAAEILQAAGLSFDNVVNNRVYITDVAHFSSMNDVYREYFASKLPTRATVQCGLMNSQYLVEMTMTASSLPLEVVGKPGGVVPISPGIRAGPRVYLSGMLGNLGGQTGVRPRSNPGLIPTRGDVAAQTRETLERIAGTLSKAGASPADVVDSLVYLRDVGDAAAAHAEYRRFFAEVDAPPCTTVGTGLVPADGLVEIMVTAVTR